MNDVPLDYLWKNITSKFEKVIPQKYYKFDSSVESLADRAEQIDRNIREFENQNQMKYFHLQPTV